MADATGTPTSPDNIPTYSTSGDPPSGKGFNTAMTAIQQIITQLKAGTLASGKIAAGAITPSGVNGQILTTSGGATSWQNAPSTGPVFRKVTPKAATNTVTETDLLNGEFTLGANVLSTNLGLRLTLWGDYVYTSGGLALAPRFKLKFGAGPTVVLDTSAGPGLNSAATRFPWRAVVEFLNLGAANAQWVSLFLSASGTINGNNAVAFTTGEGFYTSTLPATGGSILAQGGVSSTIDTTIANLVQFTVINGSATTTETKLLGAIAEIL